ncbi:MAG TPA: HNH endonuclease signature motif containing protein [Actinospica sp.]|nr:HNH endonuclease signature motif containing protein [Actinospica sp.]
MAEAFTAWSFSSKPPGAASWAGNMGYEDELGSHYMWDSGVANHKRVQPGHAMVLRNAATVLGFGWIEELTRESGTKQRRRCPVCDSTRVEPRASMVPRYRCYHPPCKAEFDEPQLSEENVTRYTGFYGGSWQPLISGASSTIPSTAFLDNAQQNAIRGLSPAWVRSLLEKGTLDGHGWSQTAAGVYTIPGGHTTGEARIRRGQGSFRKALLDRFGAVCAITGPQPAEVLEAAHLYGYAAAGHHDVEQGGLLLRSDIHALFDRYLVGIDPDTWTVRLGASIRESPSYAEYEGAELRIPEELKPDAGYLRTQLLRVLG